MVQPKISTLYLPVFIAAAILTCHMGNAYASSADGFKNDELRAPAASSSSSSSLSTAAADSSDSSSIVDPTPHSEAKKNLAVFSEALEAAFKESRERDREPMSQLERLESQAKQQGKHYAAQHFADLLREEQQKAKSGIESNSERLGKKHKVLTNLKVSEKKEEGIEPIGIFNLFVLQDLTREKDRRALKVYFEKIRCFFSYKETVITVKSGAEICIPNKLLEDFINIINEEQSFFGLPHLGEKHLSDESERISAAEIVVALKVAEDHRQKIKKYFLDLIEERISPCAPEGLILTGKHAGGNNCPTM